MFKNKKSLLICSSVFLVAVLLFGAFMPALAVEETEEPTIPSLSEIDRTLLKEFDMNTYSWLLFQDIIDCFPKASVSDEFMVKPIVVYPDEFAGAFIDEDNSLHIVLTKSVDAELEFDYRAITGYDETVVFDVAEFSLSFLYDVQKTVDEAMEEFDVKYTGINECMNRLEISLFDQTKERDIVMFLKTQFDGFNDGCIVFNYDIGEIQPSAANTSNNALAGSNINHTNGAWAGTLGFNAYRVTDGAYGVVTAGHVASVGTTMNNAMGSTIGTTSASFYSGGGTIDAAFIPFASSSSVSSSDRLFGSFPTAYDDYLTNYMFNDYYLIVGLAVDKIGGNTSRNSGTIQVVSTTASVNNSGVMLYFSDQVKISNEQQPGDSGGPTYHPIKLPNRAHPNVLIGIATFKDNLNSYGYVSKITNMFTYLGVLPYSSNLPGHAFIIKQAVPYGSGSVTNANNMLGDFTDGKFANIKGTAANAGGQIISITNRPVRGDIWIYARSVGSTDLYTYAAFDFNGPWTQTACQTVQNSANAQWIHCGTYTKNDLWYLGLAAINDNGNPANINIDMAIFIPR